MFRLTWILILISWHLIAQPSASMFFQPTEQAQFAAAKIEKSLRGEGFSVVINPQHPPSSHNLTIILATFDNLSWSKSITNIDANLPENLQPGGFGIRINPDNKTVFVIGHDLAGVMYGGLELAEQIMLKGVNSFSNTTQNPYMKKRGVKMNIPLDVRTPSYTDMSDVAQHNMPEMWSMNFWKAYLDSLACYRYNFVSLWSLHPFPSMVRVPEYPDVALDDVHRSKARFQEYYSTRTTGFDAPEIVDNYEVVKKISMEEKIKFWRAVMQYAKNRNIDFYIVTWNIYTNGTNGKYGITADIRNPVTKDYFRKSVKQLFITYPLLAGVGLTTGENMPGADFQEKEDWAFDTYAQGVMDVSKIQPERKITLIHRQHEAGALDIVKKFHPLIENKNINFVFSFKYAQAHVYSSTKQIHHHEFVKQIQEAGKFKTLWTLRNDDVYYFRWGSPDFVREFIQNIPMDVTEGYYYGSDQYVWGREFLGKYPHGDRPIEIAKHWYQWMLWGRLGYNPQVGNALFIDHLTKKYPFIDGQKLFDAWQSASLIYPLTTGFHYGALDFQWYIEACKSRPEPAQTSSGFHDVNRFITLPPYKATGFISIPDYVKAKTDHRPIHGTTPLEVAEKISRAADNALNLVSNMRSSGDMELYKTIEDIKAMAFLGKYYAHKIQAATHLAAYRQNESDNLHQSVVDELNLSALYWRHYASTALAQYKNPLWTNRVGYVDWKDIFNYVIKDIVDQKGEVRIPDMQVTQGGTVLEGESASLENAEVITQTKRFTGDGYVSSTAASNKITFAYTPMKAGTYIAEVRYTWKTNTTSADASVSTPVYVNNIQSADLAFWASGGTQNWVWDKVQLTFTEGKQTISFNLPKGILLDHINIYAP